ncbi:MAG: 2Fe-2S iron-sulfur cluster binding domain-containing protein [Bdellovibrionales bacterium]|nr:2Fe-2S iron-sulfur cluster binding domain-containing protein [Bdellovibrionales bacterium]
MTTKLTIELYGEKQVIDMEEGETVLDAALRSNVDAPYACMSGTCNSCQAHVVSGTVEMDGADALTEDEIASGEVLTCCTKATSESLHIKYPE